MGDWIGFAVIVGIVAGGLFTVSRFGARPKQISQEEFEKRVKEGAYTRAGMFALQELLHPKAVKSVEVQQDLKHGYYNQKKIPGDGEDSPKSKVQSPKSKVQSPKSKVQSRKSKVESPKLKVQSPKTSL